MDRKQFAIIMAGGVGSRFWPLSRNAKPKQFLDILGVGRTFIQQTFDRLHQLVPADRILVVTSEAYKGLVMDQLPLVKEDNILLEPARRNTGPCIAYATYKLLETNPDATVIVSPADHLILNEHEFRQTVVKAMAFAAEGDRLVTIGIKPTRPETEYGYIQVADHTPGGEEHKVCKVKTFTEKPDLELANVFLKSGEFFWNSGIFVWSLSSIRKAFETYLPEVAGLFAQGRHKYNSPDEADFIDEVYPECSAVSIDYGIMEKADNVYIINAEFGWSDMGTWTSLYLLAEKDDHSNAVLEGNVSLHRVSNTLVKVQPDKLTVLEGLDDYLVVDSDNVLMVCKRGSENEIKQLVQNVLIDKGSKYA